MLTRRWISTKKGHGDEKTDDDGEVLGGTRTVHEVRASICQVDVVYGKPSPNFRVLHPYSAFAVKAMVFQRQGIGTQSWNWGWNALMERIYPRAALFYRDGKAYSGRLRRYQENRQEEEATTEKEPPTVQT
jgi:hypothetical protein